MTDELVAIKNLKTIVTDSDDPLARRAAINALGNLGSPAKKTLQEIMILNLVPDEADLVGTWLLKIGGVQPAIEVERMAPKKLKKTKAEIETFEKATEPVRESTFDVVYITSEIISRVIEFGMLPFKTVLLMVTWLPTSVMNGGI